MRKNLRIILSIILLIIFIIIYFIYRKESLNNYLNLTIDTQNKINYSTSIDLNIYNEILNQKFIYNIDKSSYIQKITVETYSKDELTSSILKYIVSKGSKKGTYILDEDEYKKIENETTIDIDYNKLKENIISIKSMKDKKEYREYIVKIKGYDAYNLIYGKNILAKEDYDKNILLTILIDKKNSFVSEIRYEIEDITSTKDYKVNYSVNIKNTNINNKNQISLPF